MVAAPRGGGGGGALRVDENINTAKTGSNLHPKKNDPVGSSCSCTRSAGSNMDSDAHVSAARGLNFDPNGG